MSDELRDKLADARRQIVSEVVRAVVYLSIPGIREDKDMDKTLDDLQFGIDTDTGLAQLAPGTVSLFIDGVEALRIRRGEDTQFHLDVIANALANSGSVEKNWVELETSFRRALEEKPRAIEFGRRQGMAGHGEIKEHRAQVRLLKDRLAQAELSLRNVRALAVRMRKAGNTQEANHLLRFCAEARIEPNILRDLEGS